MFRKGEIVRVKSGKEHHNLGNGPFEVVAQAGRLIMLKGQAGGWLDNRFEAVPQYVDTVDAASYYHAIVDGQLS